MKCNEYLLWDENIEQNNGELCCAKLYIILVLIYIFTNTCVLGIVQLDESGHVESVALLPVLKTF